MRARCGPRRCRGPAPPGFGSESPSLRPPEGGTESRPAGSARRRASVRAARLLRAKRFDTSAAASASVVARAPPARAKRESPRAGTPRRGVRHCRPAPLASSRCACALCACALFGWEGKQPRRGARHEQLPRHLWPASLPGDGGADPGAVAWAGAFTAVS